MIACKNRILEINSRLEEKIQKNGYGEAVVPWTSSLGKTIKAYNIAENLFLGSHNDYAVHRFPSCLKNIS